MSLLLSEGHADAWSYPIWMVREEARIAKARIDAEIGSRAALMQLALLTIPNHALNDRDRKKAATHFADHIKTMTKGR